MFFKKKSAKKQYDVSKVRVRNSYYTFSADYPRSLAKPRRQVRKKRTAMRRLKILAAALCFILLCLLSFFLTDLALEISYKEDAALSETAATQDENAESEPFLSDGLRALVFPCERLADTEYLKDFVSRIQSRDANAVVLDFKTPDGHLCYSSKLNTAILGKCSVYDNQTVRNALALFESRNIAVIARIWCFEDAVAPYVDSEAAVRYMNSQVLWLDGLEEENGVPWLNPLSKNAVSYLSGIVEEVCAFGVDALILESVCFPSRGETETAGYDSKKDKNEALLSFIRKAKTAAGDGVSVFVAQTASETVRGDEQKYYGSISKSEADGVCADTFIRPEGYTVDRKTDFSGFFSLLTNMKASVNEDAVIIPMINEQEYSAKLARLMLKNGYTSYIIYDSDYEY